MLSPLIRPQEKYPKQEEALLELQITMPWVHKLGSSTVLKAKSKKEKKSFTQSPFTKLMLLTQEVKDFLLCFLAPQDKSLNKSENKLIKKYQNGENKERLRLFQVYYLSIRSICWIWSAFRF